MCRAFLSPVVDGFRDSCHFGGDAFLRSFESVKQQILDRVDLVDVVSEHVALKQRGQRWIGLCPFHTEKTPSFTVRPDLGFFKCFGCGQGGDLFSFVQATENVQFIEALRLLADRAGIEMDDVRDRKPEEVSRSELAKANEWAVRFFRSRLLDSSMGSEARSYVHDRGISDEISERFELGLAVEAGPSLQEVGAKAGFDLRTLVAADLLRRTDDGRCYETFRNRLIFPIRDVTHRVIGFGGRTLVDDRAKYLNTRQTVLFDKSRSLYGANLAREAIGRTGRTVVVEGYTDCIAAHQAGFQETVATLGTAMSQAQVDLLRRYGEQIILLFDSDEAGARAADRAIHVALPRGVTVRLARIPEGKDPGEFLSHSTSSDFSDVLNGAVDALEFKWSQAFKGLQDGNSERDKREAALEFLRVVSEAAGNDDLQRGRLINHAAHLVGMDAREVRDLLPRIRQRRNRLEGFERNRNPERGAGAVPRNAEQSAWCHVLEVLLNRPEVMEGRSLPPIDRIADDFDRRIASVVLDLLRSEQGLSMSGVLARVDDSVEVERVMALAQRGVDRGNYAATFQLAIERIDQAIEQQKNERTRSEWIGSKDDPARASESFDYLKQIAEAAKTHSRFAPRRMVRKVAD